MKPTSPYLVKVSLPLFLIALVTGGSALSKGPSAEVRSVLLAQEGNATTVTVETDGKAFFSVTEIAVPHRVFIDVKGASLSGDMDMPVEETAVVSKTVVEEFDEGVLGRTTRITLHVAVPVKVKKSQTAGKLLTVTLTAQAPLPEPEPQAKPLKAPAAPKALEAAKKEAPPVSKKAPAGSKPVAKKAPAVSASAAAAPKKAAAPEDKKPKSKFIGSEDPSIYEFAQEKTAAAFAALPKQVSLAKKGKNQYTGQKIDLDFKDADIHNILRLLSEVGKVNIVVSDEVKGNVTLSMRNVPWNLAMDVILEAKGLGKVKIAENVYRVAPKETLEKEQQMKIKELKNKKILKPLITRIIPISYAMAKDLKPQAEELLSSRGSVGMDERTNVLIVRDVSENLSLIEQLIKNLDTQTPQVLIEARIVESTSNYSREIGIQWGGHFISSTSTGNPTGVVFPNSVTLAGGGMDEQTPTSGMNPFGGSPNPNFAVNLPALVGTGAGGALGISLGSVNNNANLNIRISALENDGVLKIISAPKILTLDNKQAKIEQGTMIPYSQISAQGVQTAFQEAKLSLEVTPHVTAEGSILMKININRDEPDFNNRGARGDPTILKRHAETELLIEDGKTAVIGGIYTRNYGKSFNQVPLFAKIPVIGWLFKKRTDTDRRSELLIFITPRIVNRAESIGK
jgi:type IV pilus secretin PilQ/predicted competence protein